MWNETPAPPLRAPKTTNRSTFKSTSGWSLWNTFSRANGAKLRVCVYVRAALSSPRYTFSGPDESTLLLPACWLPPFTLFNMCNSHFLWLVSKRPRGKSAVYGSLPKPSFMKDSQSPLRARHGHPPTQNKHDSKWLAGYVIMIIALFPDNLITWWLLLWLSRISRSDIYKKVEALTD